MKEDYNTFYSNITRVNHFIDLYEKVTYERGTKGRTSTKTTDILRAGVVFLHASLEEYLRSLIFKVNIRRLNNGDKEVLKNTSLPPLDSSRPKRGEKYDLQDLFDYKGNSIDSLLKDSIRSRVEFITFNDYSQVMAELKNIGIDISKVFFRTNQLDECINEGIK